MVIASTAVRPLHRGSNLEGAGGLGAGHLPPTRAITIHPVQVLRQQASVSSYLYSIW